MKMIKTIIFNIKKINQSNWESGLLFQNEVKLKHARKVKLGVGRRAD